MTPRFPSGFWHADIFAPTIFSRYLALVLVLIHKLLAQLHGYLRSKRRILFLCVANYDSLQMVSLYLFWVSHGHWNWQLYHARRDNKFPGVERDCAEVRPDAFVAMRCPLSVGFAIADSLTGTSGLLVQRQTGK